MIFQLYKWDVVVHTPNFDRLLGTHAMGSLGSLHAGVPLVAKLVAASFIFIMIKIV